jgi:hypothetical protein
MRHELMHCLLHDFVTPIKVPKFCGCLQFEHLFQDFHLPKERFGLGALKKSTAYIYIYSVFFSLV